MALGLDNGHLAPWTWTWALVAGDGAWRRWQWQVWHSKARQLLCCWL
jgi:hypothetical protein